MPDDPGHNHLKQGGGHQLQETIDDLIQLVLDGLRHGHFSCTISSSIGKGKRREIVIKAGKSQKYTVPEDELLP